MQMLFEEDFAHQSLHIYEKNAADRLVEEISKDRKKDHKSNPKIREG